MKTYTFLSGTIPTEKQAPSLYRAIADYITPYDTTGMVAGQKFTIPVFDSGPNGRRIATVRAVANGVGRVSTYEISG